MTTTLGKASVANVSSAVINSALEKVFCKTSIVVSDPDAASTQTMA